MSGPRPHFCPGSDNCPRLQPPAFSALCSGHGMAGFPGILSVSNNVLPLGSLVLTLFCCSSLGWGWENFVQEANTGHGLKVKAWMKPVFRFVVPIAIAFIYIYGMATFAWR